MPLTTSLLSRLIKRGFETLRAPRALQSPLLLEALEPRVLLSGDPMGARVDGSLDVAGETDRYSFTLSDDLRVVFDSLTQDLGIRWTLNGPNGALVTDRSFSSSDSIDFSSPIAMDLTAGDYTLTVDGAGDATGAYSFRLLNLALAPTLALGAVASGQLDPANQTDAFAFSVAAGQSVYFDNRGSTGDAYWRILDPFGRQVSGPNSLGTDPGRLSLAFDGSYTLLVEGRIDSTGSADYSFVLHAVEDVARSIAPGVADAMEPGWVAGELAGGLHLNGQQAVQVQASAALDLTSAVTMEAWVRVDQYDNAWTPLFSKSAGDVQQRTYSLELSSDGRVRLGTGDGGFESLSSPAGLVSPGEWHHVAGVIDRTAGILRIVVDGIERASGTIRTGSSFSNAAAPLLIGNEAFEGFADHAPLSGTIDEVRLWNVARSNADIAAALGTPLAGSEAGLALYLKLDEATGATPIDSSAAAHAVALLQSTSGVVANRIPMPGGKVVYQVDIAAATRLYFDSLSSNGSLRWSLTGPRGDVVSNHSFQSSDSADGSSIFDVVAGRYTLVADSVDASTPAFAFRLLDLAEATPITPGVPVAGTLTTARQTDAYRFDAAAGDRFFLDDTLASGGDTYWRLLDPFGRTLIGPGAIADDFDAMTVPYAGTYTLLVEGRYSAGGGASYAFNVQPVLDGLQAMALGIAVDGAIAQPGQQQRYQFSVATATTVVFDALLGSDAFRWSLAGPLGGPVTERGFAGSDSADIFGDTTLPLAAGDYTLTVDASGAAIGSFAFRLIDLAEALPLVLGAVHAARLEPGSATEAFRFDASAGDEILLDRIGLSGAGAYVRLIDPIGRQIAGPLPFDDQTFAVPMSGSYTLLVEGRNSEASPLDYEFQLALQGNTPPEPLTGTALALGDTVVGEIAAVGEVDDFIFAISAPTRIVFDGLTGDYSGFDWQLDGPRGAESARENFADATDAGARPAIALVAPGTYRIRVAGNGGTTGSYSFRVLDLAAATTFIPGDAVSGTLDPANSTQAYSFSAVADSRYFFDRTASSGGETYWRLLDPSGRPVWGPQLVSSDTDVTTLRYAGTYTLLLEGRYSAGGTATYGFNVVPVVDDTATLVLGALSAGSIAAPGQRDTYTFTLAEAQRVAVDVQSDSPATRWSLAGPRGVVIENRYFFGTDSIDGTSIFELAAGDYTVVVDADDDITGNYAFRLLGLATAMPIAAGTPVVGTLDPANATHAFRFDAVAGQRYFFDHTASAGDTYWRLIDPFGNAIWGPQGIAGDATAALPFSGIYTLLIEGRFYVGGTANYAFTVKNIDDDTAAMSLDALVSGSIASPGQRDFHTFTVAETTRVAFDGQTDDNGLYWSLRGPRGDVVVDRRFYSSDSFDGVSFFQLAPGDYTLSVDADDDVTADYDFRLLDLANATTFVEGELVGDTLDPASATRAYRFDAVAGERWFFDRTASSGDTYWRLIDPNGVPVWGASSMLGDQDVTTLARTGSYTLLVEGRYYVGGTASYAFRVNRVTDVERAIVPGIEDGMQPGWTASGRIGGALVLNGEQTLRIDASPALDLASTVTLETWVKVDQYDHTWTPLFYKGNGNQQQRTYSMWLNVDGRVQVATGDGGLEFLETAAGLVVPGTWTHVAGIIDRTDGTIRIVVDGVERAAGTIRTGSSWSSPGGPLLVGNLIDERLAGYGPLSGTLDDVRVWNVARSTADVAAGRNDALTGSEAGLVMYLELDDSSGATPADSAAAPQAVSLLPNGSAVVSGRIALPGQRVTYSFDLAGAGRLYFDTLTNIADLRWSLAGPRGVVTSDRSFTSSDSADGSGFFDLVAGAYSLVIDGVGDLVAHYAFRLLDLANATPITPGTTVVATLSPARETDAYTFDASAGERFFFDTTVDSGGDTWWRLIDPFGRTVFGPSPIGIDRDVTTLAYDGAYTLLVEGRSYTSGEAGYAFNVQKVDDVVRAIVPGLADGYPIDWTDGQVGGGLSLNPQQHLVVQAAPSLDLGTTVTMEAWLEVDRFDATWTPVFYKGNGNSQQRTYSLWLNADGRVRVAVGDGGLESVETAAGLVRPGQWVHVAGVVDRSTGSVRIVVDGVERANGSIRTGASTASPAAPLLIGATAEIDNSYASLFGIVDELRVWSVARSTAEIAAARNAELTGNEAGLALYLKLNETAGPGATDSSPFAQIATRVAGSSGVVAGRIGHAGQRVVYSVVVPAATRLYFDSLTNDSTLSWSLASPAGVITSNRSFQGSDSVDGSAVFDLDPGTYTLVVDGNGDATPRFAFRLLDLSAATALVPGATVSGSLSPARETDAYRFDAVAGGRIFFDTTLASGGDTWVRLLDPFGRTLIGPASLGDIDVRTLPYTGIYTVLVEGRYYVANRADYAFVVQPVIDASQALAVGAQVDGAIASPGQRQRYIFTLAAQSRLLFDSLSNTGLIGWSLTGPLGSLVSGRRFDASDSGALGGATLLDLAAGDYVLTVDADGDATGGFSFRMLDLADATAIAMDADVAGTLSPGNATRLYKFDATAGDQVLFDRRALTGGSPHWRLVDPIGVLLFGPEPFDDRAVITLAMTGTYFVFVEGAVGDSAVTGYTFNLDLQGNTPPLPLTGAAISFGSAVDGEIAAAGEADDYVFTIAGPTRLVFDGRGTDPSFGWRIDGPRGLEVARGIATDSFGGGAAAAISLVVPGIYRLRMTGNGSTTGSYGFVLIDLAAATALTPGTPVSGTLDPANSTQAYKFDALAGERFYFDRTANFGGDTYWRLLDPAGRPVFGPTSIGADVDVTTLALAGTYTLLVEGRYGAGGTAGYTVNVRSVSDDSAALALGTVVSSTIAHTGQRDSFAFTLAEGRRVVFDSQTDNADFRWALAGPRGTVTADRSFTGSDSIDGSAIYDLPAGAYTLTVDGSGDATGDYAFQLIDLGAATPIVPGTTVSGTLDPASSTRLYRFDATAGQRYYFDRTASSGETYWRLIDPNGRGVWGPGNLNTDIGVTTLAVSGSYTLLVEGRHFVAGTAAYAFALQQVSDDTATMALDTAVGGTIAHPGQSDVHTFTLGEAKRVVFDSRVDSSAFHWSLTGPRGTLAADRGFQDSDSVDGSAIYDLVAGDYVLAVHASGDATGDYAFALLDLANATPISPGASFGGTLDPASATQLYRFDAAAGDRYFFDRTASSGGDTYWRLLDPFGRSIWGPTPIASDVDSVSLSLAGTYTLLFEGRYFVDGTASYMASVQPSPISAAVPITGLEGGSAEPGPDLQIQNLSVTPAGGTLRSGGTVTVRWEVVNTGDQPADAPWLDRLLVRNLDRGELIRNVLVDYVDLGAGASLPLLPGQSRSREVTIDLPPGNAGAGSLRFEVSTDVTNVVGESGGADTGEANNLTAVIAASQLVAYPDLQVVGLAVDPASSFGAGQTVTASWTVRNAGTAPVTASFTDTLVVRNLGTGEVLVTRVVAHDLAGDGELAAGAERSRQASFTWPAGTIGSGQFEFIVNTDSGDAVFENNAGDTAETNNSARIAITSAADLTVQSLQVAPGAVAAGDTVTLEWTDRNDGVAATPLGWTDRIVVRNLDSGEILLDRTLAYDPSLPGNAPLAAGGSLVRTTSFTLPAGQRGAGQIEVSIAADQNSSGQGAMPEFTLAGDPGENNNSATVTFTADQRAYADLRISQFTTPASG
ncbi:MAG: LamG-like jellyroll fold domain-containing protein, partial [Caldimonas sp.]